MDRVAHNRWMLAKMPVIVLGSIGIFLILHNISFVGWTVGLVGLAITTFIEASRPSL
jgi:hypothetical protein